MNIRSLTPIPSGVTLLTDNHGYENILVVAKATFLIDTNGPCRLAPMQLALTRSDVHYGDPGVTSVRYECDFAPPLRRTDVVLNGSAYSPLGRPAAAVVTTLKVSTLVKSIHVFGDRQWTRSVSGAFHPSRPKLFTSIPLTYNRAFGGTDQTHRRPAYHAFEARNLVGVGLHAYLHDGIVGTPLPNLEDPARLIQSPLDRPPPAAYGFLGRGWQPRSRYAGTYDQAWLDERYPFLPSDFDERYYHGVPPEQICGPLRGGENVELLNLSPEGQLCFALPTLPVPIKLLWAGGLSEDLDPCLSTVLLEPDERRIILTWRAMTRLHGKPSLIRDIWVGEPSRARLRALATGKRFIERSRPPYA